MLFRQPQRSACHRDAASQKPPTLERRPQKIKTNGDPSVTECLLRTVAYKKSTRFIPCWLRSEVAYLRTQKRIHPGVRAVRFIACQGGHGKQIFRRQPTSLHVNKYGQSDL